MRRVALAVLTVALFAVWATGIAAAETITWWHWNPQEVMDELYQPLIDAFEAETGIEVETQMVGWSDMQERLTVALAGGVAPDVVVVSSRWGDAAASDGAFEDITRFVEMDDTFDDFFPAVMELWQTWDGKQYGIPGDLDIPALFYNKEMFQSHGMAYPTDIDWNDWYDISLAMTRDNDGDGEFDQYGWTNWWYVWLTLVWANGGDIINADRTDVALGTDEARQAIDFYKQFVDGKMLPGMEDAKRLGFPHPAALWKGGQVGMAPAGAWMPQYWVFDNESGQYSFDFDVAHMPKSYNGGRATPIEGSAMAIPKGANVEAAWKFIRFMTSEDAMRAIGLDGFPARISVAREAFSQPNRQPENSLALIEVVEYARPFPRGVNWWGGVYSGIMGELNKYVTGQTSFSGALENIRNAVKPLLEEAKEAQGI